MDNPCVRIVNDNGITKIYYVKSNTPLDEEELIYELKNDECVRIYATKDGKLISN